MAPSAKLEASHISSNGYSQLGACRIGADVSQNLTCLKNERTSRAEAGHERHKREKRRERRYRREDMRGDLDLGKCKIPQFGGDCKLKVYIDWELKVEQLITSFDVQGRKGVSLAVVALEDYVLVWWTSLMNDIRIGIEEPSESWYDLKRMIRKRFVPASYDFKSVEEYHKEKELTLLRAQIREREKATIARFLHGLNREIHDIVELLGTLVHQAIKVEMQLKRRSASRRSTASSSSWRDRDKEKVRSDRSLKKGSDPFQVYKEMIITPTPRTSDIKCFKCLGKRHIASQCPNKRAMILRDDGDIESDSSLGDTSTSSDLESRSDDSHVEGDLLMVRRLMWS
ncbi:hypothetical protein CR513_03136, partial [Mucuna pruriens]